jgi:hypothetical protein
MPEVRGQYVLGKVHIAGIVASKPEAKVSGFPLGGWLQAREH